MNTWNISVCVEWMYTLYKFHFLNGISEIIQLFDDILIIWPAPVYIIWFIICDVHLSIWFIVWAFIYHLVMTGLYWVDHEN